MAPVVSTPTLYLCFVSSCLLVRACPPPVCRLTPCSLSINFPRVAQDAKRRKIRGFQPQGSDAVGVLLRARRLGVMHRPPAMRSQIDTPDVYSPLSLSFTRRPIFSSVHRRPMSVHIVTGLVAWTFGRVAKQSSKEVKSIDKRGGRKSYWSFSPAIRDVIALLWEQ